MRCWEGKPNTKSSITDLPSKFDKRVKNILCATFEHLGIRVSNDEVPEPFRNWKYKQYSF